DTIAFNSGDGVSVVNNLAIGNSIEANSIHDNGSLGIDLGNITLPGTLILQSVQQFPVQTIVSGEYFTSTVGAIDIDFYASPAPNVAGFGEGQRYLGSVSAFPIGPTGAVLTAHFQIFLPPTNPGDIITATATDAATNTTSPFSSYLVAGPLT